MSSHANCTHEKTKAARAACRAGKAPRGDMPRAATRLREKATGAASKLGEARHESGDLPVTSAISGFCGNDTHDRCPGGGKQWHCDCACHVVVTE